MEASRGSSLRVRDYYVRLCIKILGLYCVLNISGAGGMALVTFTVSQLMSAAIGQAKLGGLPTAMACANCTAVALPLISFYL